MIGDIQYEVENRYGPPSTVTGMQVGRFAVRNRLPDELVHGVMPRAFLVDHIPSRCVLVYFDTFAEALGFADDISRFSTEDPAGTDPAIAMQQVGSNAIEWAASCLKRCGYTPYREWLAARSQAA